MGGLPERRVDLLVLRDGVLLRVLRDGDLDTDGRGVGAAPLTPLLSGCDEALAAGVRPLLTAGVDVADFVSARDSTGVGSGVAGESTASAFGCETCGGGCVAAFGADTRCDTTAAGLLDEQVPSAAAQNAAGVNTSVNCGEKRQEQRDG